MRFLRFSIWTFQRLDVVEALVERLRHRIVEQRAARELVADDLHARREDLVAVRMVEVEVRVDDRRHRLVGDRLDFLEQHPRGGRRHVVVDDDDVAVVDDDRRVADDRQRAGSDGVVDAFLDLVEPEGLARERRSGGTRGLAPPRPPPREGRAARESSRGGKKRGAGRRDSPPRRGGITLSPPCHPLTPPPAPRPPAAPPFIAPPPRLALRLP